MKKVCRKGKIKIMCLLTLTYKGINKSKLLPGALKSQAGAPRVPRPPLQPPCPDPQPSRKKCNKTEENSKRQAVAS